MPYTADHADALASIREAGAAVTFTTRTATHAPTTGLFTTPTTSTVTGYAMRVKANREQEDAYRTAGIVSDRVVALLFAPTTYGSLPTLGATVTWNGESLTAKGVTPVAPDGTALLARVWCIR